MCFLSCAQQSILYFIYSNVLLLLLKAASKSNLFTSSIFRTLRKDMELELGVRITHNKDDTTTDFRISKDSSNPLFMSKETNSMFILTGHLKGYLRENIDIKINREGDRLTVSGKKAVQEMAMNGWIMRKKDVEVREFRKVFRITDVINLDRIKATFSGEETLKIQMPKLARGMLGIQIEEVEDEADKAQPEEEVPEEIKEVKPPEAEEVNHQEHEEVKKQEEPIAEEKPKKKKKSKGFHPCPPIVFAGSTSILLTILLLLFNLLRSDRR